MRHLGTVLALVLLACGSSNSSPASGTVGGASFTPVDVEALTVVPTTCTLTQNEAGLGQVSVAGLVIAFSSTAGLCGDLTSDLSAAGPCVFRANSAGATIFIADVGLNGPASIKDGQTYQVIANPALVTPGYPDFAVAFGESHRLGAAPDCTPTSGTTPVTATGTVVISGTSASKVEGQVDVKFSDGGALKGSFTADVCGVTLPICQVANAAIANQGAPVSLCVSGLASCE